MGSLNKTTLGEKSGSILLVSLWVLALLGVAAGSVAFRLNVGLKLSRYRWEEIQMAQLSKTATIVAFSGWQKTHATYESMNQAWSRDTRVPQSETSYRMSDESGKLNLNHADPETLRRLFGIYSVIIPALVEWRNPLTGPAKSGDYVALSYAPRHGPFKSVEELLLLKGMTSEIFESVKEQLTVYGSGAVNLNTASFPVMKALGMPDSLVNKILYVRRGADGIEGTTDDGVFESASTIVSVLKKKSSLTELEARLLVQLLGRNALSVQAECFRVSVSAKLNESPAVRRFAVVVSARSRPGRILSWREVL